MAYITSQESWLYTHTFRPTNQSNVKTKIEIEIKTSLWWSLLSCNWWRNIIHCQCDRFNYSLSYELIMQTARDQVLYSKVTMVSILSLDLQLMLFYLPQEGHDVRYLHCIDFKILMTTRAFFSQHVSFQTVSTLEFYHWRMKYRR